MPTYFISDLHLDEAHPQITDLFVHFLATAARDADALYILGDLFEVWVGDDEHTPLQQLIQTKLLELNTQGIPIYFIHGNRDFLLGQRYAKACGMTLLPDPTLINLYGRPTLIMHGDTLCTQDEKYLAFRAKVRRKWVQQLFLTLPLIIRKWIAAKMRAASKKHTSTMQLALMDVTPTQVSSLMQNHQVDLLIHGHTHQPATHTEQTGQRIVLGAWHDQGHCLIMHKDGSYQLKKF